MPTEFLPLLQQAPIVGIFVLFVLIWSDRLQKAQDKRDRQMMDYINSLRQEDKAFREADRAVLQSLVHSIEKLASYRRRQKSDESN